MDYKLKPGSQDYKSLSDYGPQSFCFYEGFNLTYVETLKPEILVLQTSMEGAFNPVPLVTYLYADSPKEYFFEHFISDVIPAIYEYKRIGSSYVAPNVLWGEDCHFEGNNLAHSNTTIGDRVSIKFGAVIGGQGFNVVTINGKSQMLPHIGGVKIGNDVFIGSNTCIDKGLLGNTIIGDDTKIDNLVHIAHNVKIGKNCRIIANAMIAGSVEIGDNTWVAPSSSIREKIKIGSQCFIGLHSCVVKDVDDNCMVYGVPAKRPVK